MRWRRGDAALASSERSISLAPDDAKVYDSKGAILMKMERYADGLPCSSGR